MDTRGPRPGPGPRIPEPGSEPRPRLDLPRPVLRPKAPAETPDPTRNRDRECRRPGFRTLARPLSPSPALSAVELETFAPSPTILLPPGPAARL